MSSSSSSSVLFQPYRSLGLISSSTRPHLKLLGQERFLTAALGKSWCVYNLDKLRVSLMGGAREYPIRSIVSARDLTFTANGREIIVWRRQEEVYRIQFHESNVYLLYLFGFTLISVSEDQQLAVWDVRALTPATSVKSQVATALTMSNNVAKKTYVSQTGEKMDSDWKAEPMSVIQFPTSSRISCVLHPSTYLNKIVVAFGGGEGSAAAGGMELWNIKTRSMIYRFKTDTWNSDKHNPDRALDATLGRTSGVKNEANVAAPAVTCIEQSPAVDVIAVGLHSGLILLLNLQLDQLLHVYLHATPTASGEMVSAPIASVTFRTDNNQSQLASTTTNSGTVCIWDLEKKQLRTQIKHAHGIASTDGTAVRGTAAGSSDSSVTIHSLFFLPNEPLLLTVGTDNAIRMWIFDNPDGTARLLKERAGHSGPPSRIRFYPGERNCLDVVSAGLDRSLRAFSLQKEEQSREFSQGSVEKKAKNFSMATSDLKLTPVVDFAVSTARERDWANILTAHAGDCAGYTWKWSSRALSQHKLLNTNAGAMASAVKSVAVSACGNFGYLGYTNGRIDSFHMQSGTWKASFGSNHSSEAATGGATLSKDLQSKNINLKRKAAKDAAKAAANGSAESQLPPNFGHSAAVTGVATDGLNKQVISASLDGSVIFWDFKRRHVLKRLTFDSPISRMTYSRENDLLAVVTDRLVVHVIDAITYAVVRRFKQHTAPLTDLCFSPDARWLLTSSIDCCVRIFDLPSSTMIDFMKFNKPISSLTMSPKCDFLATTHVGNLGIYLWANKDYFGNSSSTGADLAGEAKVRRVYKNKPVEMEVKERATGEESDEEMEDGEETTHTRMKLEPLSDSESDDDEDEDDEDQQDRKRRKTSSEPASALSHTHTPFLHIPDEEQFGLITYSTVAKAKWQTLAHLEEIKERNKVKEAVQAPKDAPFFLTAISSLSNEKDGASIREKERLAETFGVSATETSSSSTAPALGKRTVKSGGTSLESTFINLIEQAKSTLAQLVSKKKGAANAAPPANPRLQLIQAFDKVTEFLQDLTPAGIDAEIASLGLDPSTEEHEFQLVLEYFLAGLESQKGFEFIQALLNRFLKIHGSSLINYPQLLKLCQTLLTTQKNAWGRLEQSFQANLALVSHLAQIQL